MRRSPTFKPGEAIVAWLSRFIVILVILVSLIPMLYVVSASINPGQADFSASLIPPHASLINYVDLFEKQQFLVWIRNSTVVSLTVGVVQIITTGLGAYAFSRMKFFGRRYGLMTLILLQMFPTVLAVPAIYTVLAQMGLLDNIWIYSLVLIGGTAFNIWLVKGYYDTIPKELDESAIMDGATHLQILWRIIMPLARPMLAVIFFLTVISVFSEFVIASTVLQSPQNYTLGIGLYNMVNGQFATHLWGEFAAGALIAAIPLTVAFALLQPLIARGLTAGAVKG
ncbi:MAG: sugar ABC transporter permease [Firmicutes bacterium]|nr:sugar ABC transporter permease [Bacillota bacterium]